MREVTRHTYSRSLKRVRRELKGIPRIPVECCVVRERLRYVIDGCVDSVSTRLNDDFVLWRAWRRTHACVGSPDDSGPTWYLPMFASVPAVPCLVVLGKLGWKLPQALEVLDTAYDWLADVVSHCTYKAH